MRGRRLSQTTVFEMMGCKQGDALTPPLGAGGNRIIGGAAAPVHGGDGGPTGCFWRHSHSNPAPKRTPGQGAYLRRVAEINCGDVPFYGAFQPLACCPSRSGDVERWQKRPVKACGETLC